MSRDECAAAQGHDCNEHMVELDDGFGWDCAICWDRKPTDTANSKRCEDWWDRFGYRDGGPLHA